MSTILNPALERAALFSKSQVYIRRGLRAQNEGDTEEYQLWSSLALELLGKSALSKIHPVLISDPTHFPSLFAACGRQLSPDIKTIAAPTLFERLSHIERRFDDRHQKFCKQMAIRRNSELHSGESPFSGMPAEAWEREYWGAIALILSMQDETLVSWLGTEKSLTPSHIIEQADEALKWVVENRLVRYREDFQKANPDPKRREDKINQSDALSWKDRSWEASERQVCPACSCAGFIGGSLWCEEVVESGYARDENGMRCNGMSGNAGANDTPAPDHNRRYYYRL